MELQHINNLKQRFDCVVMLTWSDWKTEPRSNRYHYATRFARHLPVFFVQSDAEKSQYSFEPTEIANITILHVPKTYDAAQSALLALALNEKRCISPLLWCYTPLYSDFVESCYSPLKVYHATEDYFSPDWPLSPEYDLPALLRRTLDHIDLVVAVSDGVAQSYIRRGGYSGDILTLPNGCDYAFWRQEVSNNEKKPPPRDQARKIALYQGGINERLDVKLLTKLASLTADIEYWFCGKVSPTFTAWNRLSRISNIKYLGELSPEVVREYAYRADVGIVPLVQNSLIKESSLPLKAFEYVACGLPVVSVPIDSLKPYGELFRFAGDAESFATALRDVIPSRREPDAVHLRLEKARSTDYEVRFKQLVDHISISLGRHKLGSDILNILILYDASSTHTTTVHEYLESFRRFSRHNIYYAHAVWAAECDYDLSLFDVVVIHYCVRLALPNHISPSFAERLKQYAGLKILYIQDEYDTTEVARRWIETLGLQVVHTCVPPKYIQAVYPAERFSKVQFVHVLTGYVPIFELPLDHIKPIEDRQVLIGYRGRPLGYWYGKLGQEKIFIGKRMRELCDQRGLVTDIEWTHEKRIYGDGWYKFLANCKATLGTESGANVFDDHGVLRANVERDLKHNPDISFEEIFDKYLSEHEGKVKMNQVSPKIFEAIILRTALVLFEGEYSDVLIPDRHFIPLKKDFSNVDEVLDKLHDNGFLSQMTETAYREVIRSGKYSYNNFIKDFDGLVSSKVRRSRRLRFLTTITGAHVDDTLIFNRLAAIGAGMYQLTASAVASQDIAIVFPKRLSLSARVGRLLECLSVSAIKRGIFLVIYSGWRRVPSGVRDLFRPVTRSVAEFLLNQHASSSRANRVMRNDQK